MHAVPLRGLGLLACLCCLLFAVAADPPTSPETEKRFPPLKLPPGFKATLFACDPFIEYPSVIAAGPKANSLLVAIDYMTGLGTEIIKRDEVRLIEDTNADGYADKSTLFASGFNSIMGLAYHDGAVYVMHAPFLTVLRDTDGDGKADERKDLLDGLGLTPEKNPVRLHCANGVTVGHDGWLYLALGDNGCNVKRPEGGKVVLHGGGILRCRRDGTQLHVFATGLRNIYDVALDEDLNVFVRDNENDGGDYMIRVCHSFFGADHGYPYLYYERPDEALPPLADLGRGSSAGGVCYLETAFPAEYRGNFFNCEWGRSVVRSPLAAAGSGFAPAKEIEFASGADNDPYGFKPTDIVVQRDGAMFVSDWADGQRPKRGRGRIYRITHDDAAKNVKSALRGTALADRLQQLDSESHAIRLDAQLALERGGKESLQAVRDALQNKKFSVRGRLHAVWILHHLGADDEDLFRLAEDDAEPRVQVQAIRVLADRHDPGLGPNPLEPVRADPKIAARLAKAPFSQVGHINREVLIALGRLDWPELPRTLKSLVRKPDDALLHAGQQALRRSSALAPVVALLDEEVPIRGIARKAIAGSFRLEVVDGILLRLAKEKDPQRCRDYADLLTRIHRKPAEWVYWGYRPPPRPANTVAWERTEAVEKALNLQLAHADAATRLFALKRMQREKVPAHLDRLDAWLRQEREPEAVTALLDALREQPAEKVHDLLALVAGDRAFHPVNRLAALNLYATGLKDETQLLGLVGKLEDGPVLVDALRLLAKCPKLNSAPLVLAKLDSTDQAVRAAAVETVGELKLAEAGDRIQKFFADADVRVRRAAVTAAGKLGVRAATNPLLKMTKDPDGSVRRGSFESLRLLKDARAVPQAVVALADADSQLAALLCIADLGGPEQAKPVIELARRQPSAEVLLPVVRMLTKWSGAAGLSPDKRQELEAATAELQATSGVLVRWQASEPLSPAQAKPLIEQLGKPGQAAPRWPALFGVGSDSRINLGKAASGDVTWLAYADLQAAEAAPIQFLGASGGTLRVWLNGKLLHERNEVRPFQPDGDRFDGALIKGPNRVVVQLSAAKVPEFALRFRRKSSSAEHEKLTQAALSRAGNAARGRLLFLDVEKTQCLKCHRLGEQGERYGPELSQLGSRFARVYVVESILEPSRTIAASFETQVVGLKDGKVLIGVKVAETETQLTLADNQGKKIEIAKRDIDERRPSPQSTMPDGLEKKLTAEEFVDLIAFLVSQK
jgi:putative membrane-bound dehydrogenase-like protein